MNKLVIMTADIFKKLFCDVNCYDTSCLTIIIVVANYEMIETKCNYKGNFRENLLCQICNSERDTTEHLFVNCVPKNSIQGVTFKDISNQFMKKLKKLNVICVIKALPKKNL